MSYSSEYVGVPSSASRSDMSPSRWSQFDAGVIRMPDRVSVRATRAADSQPRVRSNSWSPGEEWQVCDVATAKLTTTRMRGDGTLRRSRS